MRCAPIHAALALVALPLLAPIAGCIGQACDLVGCIDSVSLLLEPEGGRFQNGTYELAWTFDGEPQTCAFEVADDDRCALGGPDVCVVDSDCARIGSQGEIRMIFGEMPAEVTWSLARDGAVLVEGDAEPDYDRASSGGDHCDADCMQATIDIAVP